MRHSRVLSAVFIPGRVRLLAGRLLLVCLLCLVGTSGAGDQAPVYIGLDGEFGLLNSTSAQSIERGIRIAMHEINAAGGVLGGRPLELISRDNRSVPARGKENIRQFAKVKDLVAVVGGRFSPVLLEELDLIHELKMVMLDAWAAADGITEHGYKPSFTFRLSLKDSLAMPVLLDHARSKGVRKVGLLVPNTGWGRSNVKAAEAVRTANPDLMILKPVWYNWGEPEMLRHYTAMQRDGAEAIILVSNDIEGSRLVRQMQYLEPDLRLPIISHWGITGGRMVEESGPAIQEVDLTVIQTFSLFTADAEKREQIMAVAAELFGIRSVEEIESPVGLGHAYDLIHILARAIGMAGGTDREAVREALERVEDYQGLTGYYPRPFTPERHDAMRPGQLFMARYRQDGVVVPLSQEPGRAGGE